MKDEATQRRENPLRGRLIAERYRVLEPIARGGMANVFLAEQEALGRKVALKVLGVGDRPLRPGFAKRFAREAATAARVEHPNIVTIHDFGVIESEDLYFIAMEYVDGAPLAHVIRGEGPLAPERAVGLFIQVARALRAAHRQGLVHRDLKPGNILLKCSSEGEEVVKVVDFGLVMDLGEVDPTDDGVYLGSPRYMAPEQIQPGLPLDERIDVYGLGASLYTSLVGHPPYEAKTTLETLLMHMEAPIPAVERPDGVPIPESLERVVQRCLEKHPDDRFPTIDAVLSALRRVAEGELASKLSAIPLGPASGLHPALSAQLYFDSDSEPPPSSPRLRAVPRSARLSGFAIRTAARERQPLPAPHADANVPNPEGPSSALSLAPTLPPPAPTPEPLGVPAPLEDALDHTGPVAGRRPIPILAPAITKPTLAQPRPRRDKLLLALLLLLTALGSYLAGRSAGPEDAPAATSDTATSDPAPSTTR